MTKQKPRKHKSDFDKALVWTREINDAFTDVDGLSGWHLVGVECVPEDGRDDFTVRFMDELIYTSSDGSFDPKAAEEELWRELDHEARNLNLQRRALRKHMEKS